MHRATINHKPYPIIHEKELLKGTRLRLTGSVVIDNPLYHEKKDGAAVLSVNAAYETANRCLQRGGLRYVLMLGRIGYLHVPFVVHKLLERN